MRKNRKPAPHVEFKEEETAPAALAEIVKEVKGFGGDIKSLRESTQRDLEAVRKIAEEAKGNVDPLVKEAVNKGIQSVLTKSTEIENACKAVADRLSNLEAKQNRPRLGAASADEAARTRKQLLSMHRDSLAVKGLLKPETIISDDMDLKDWEGYVKTNGLYLRRGEQRIDGEQMKTMSVGSDPDGGYFVTPATSSTMLSIIFESSPMREIANVETISTDALEYPVDEGEVGFGWVGEQESRPETTTPQVGVQRIPVHEMYAAPRATQKLLEDASVNIEAWLGRKIGEKFGRGEATAFVAGDGIKKPRGFLTYPHGTASVRGTIEQVNSGHATQVTFDGLINLMVALKEFYTSGSTFLMRRATEGAVMLLKDTTNQYLWRPDNQAGKPNLLLGVPVRQAADMEAIGASALAIAYGNFKTAYTIVDRVGISTLRDPFTAKPFVIFYTRKRVGGDVTNFEAIKIQKISA